MRLWICVLLLSLAGCGAEDSRAPLPAARVDCVVHRIADLFANKYVFPSVGDEVSRQLAHALDTKKYSAIESPDELARQLTADLQAITHDVHVRVRYGDPLNTPRGDRPAYADLIRTAAFHRVERLDGNIGYLKVAVFSYPKVFERKADAAIHALADTDALIIDVRGTPGGHGGSVAYLCSFFFDGELPVHLNSFVDRNGQQTQSWTTTVPEHYLNKPVYVLTSHETGSGAEEFAYDMQSSGRAVTVGEATAGGAHTGAFERLDADFWVFVPTGRALNPVTHTNWERVGVKPNIAVKAEEALATASSDYLHRM